MISMVNMTYVLGLPFGEYLQVEVGGKTYDTRTVYYWEDPDWTPEDFNARTETYSDTGRYFKFKVEKFLVSGAGVEAVPMRGWRSVEGKRGNRWERSPGTLGRIPVSELHLHLCPEHETNHCGLGQRVQQVRGQGLHQRPLSGRRVPPVLLKGVRSSAGTV